LYLWSIYAYLPERDAEIERERERERERRQILDSELHDRVDDIALVLLERRNGSGTRAVGLRDDELDISGLNARLVVGTGGGSRGATSRRLAISSPDTTVIWGTTGIVAENLDSNVRPLLPLLCLIFNLRNHPLVVIEAAGGVVLVWVILVGTLVLNIVLVVHVLDVFPSMMLGLLTVDEIHTL